MLIDQRFNLGLEYNNGNQNTKLHVKKKCFYIKKCFDKDHTITRTHI